MSRVLVLVAWKNGQVYGTVIEKVRHKNSLIMGKSCSTLLTSICKCWNRLDQEKIDNVVTKTKHGSIEDLSGGNPEVFF